MLHAPHMLTVCTGANLFHCNIAHRIVTQTTRFIFPCRDVNSVMLQTNYGKRRFTLKVLTYIIYRKDFNSHLAYVFVCILLYMKYIDFCLSVRLSI